MYPPQSFAEDRQEVLAQAMRDIQFACMVVSGSSGLSATHLPMVVLETNSSIVLEGHIARANPQWQEISEASDALAVFQGPQAYVHPGWYPSKAEHGKAVPTWNYIAVHAKGVIETFTDAGELRNHLETLTDFNEADRENRWQFSDAPEQYLERMMRGIIGIRLEVKELSGIWKLSQNKDTGDFEGTISGLQSEPGRNANEIVEAMQRLKH